MKPRGMCEKIFLPKQKVLTRRKQKFIEKKVNFRQMITIESIKKAIDNKLITDLNNQTYFKMDNGKTPSLLYAALDKFDVKLINYLIDQGVDPNIVEYGRLPFIKDVSRRFEGRHRFNIVKKLVEAGADINKSFNLHSWGYRSMGGTLLYYINKTDRRIVKFLIDNGADVQPICTNPDNCNGCNPLQLAVKRKMIYAVDLLLAKGVDVNKFCKNKYSPFSQAVYNEDTETIKRLLDHGANVNFMYYNEYAYPMYKTALHIAVWRKNLEVVQMLLNYELTDINAVNSNNNFSVLHYAIINNSLNCIDELLNANPDVNLIRKEQGEHRVAVEMIHYNKSNLKIVEKLKHHIIKLHAAGFYLNNQNLAAISEEKYENFYTKCCHEVNSMKTTTISPESHVNFYDLLFKAPENLALCLEYLDQNILHSGFQYKFQLYAGMIRFKLKKAYQWIKLREELSAAVYTLFNNYLPCTIMEQIFRYFSVADLVELRRCRSRSEELEKSKGGQ